MDTQQQGRSEGAWRYLWALYRVKGDNWQAWSESDFTELLFSGPANAERYLGLNPGTFQKMWTDNEPKEYYPDNFLWGFRGVNGGWFILRELPVDLVKPMS
jgi:hypothetical protein